jgi:hypothetical protein
VNIHRSTHSLGERGPLAQFGTSQDAKKAVQKITSKNKNQRLSVALAIF